MTSRRELFFICWVAFIIYAVFLAPDGNEGYLQQLMTMDDPDPLLLTVFSLLGIYPAAFAVVLLSEDDSRVPAWPFVIGSFMLGAFALIPYFFISSGNSVRKVRTPRVFLKFLQSIGLKSLLFAGTIALMIYGMIQGSAALYTQAFQVSQFVHIMTVDLVVLTLLSIYVIFWRERKHNRSNNRHWVGIIPVIGLLSYIIMKKEEVD
ncbi:hypothetical protein [Halobacillus salinus]|uniref:hypothetical protein n=1 Tax=Halobacillus salinus TaxID=192814 RepID=UPI0009A8EF9E|nr:hypothetical protein [Halobacillus salinus]